MRRTGTVGIATGCCVVKAGPKVRCSKRLTLNRISRLATGISGPGISRSFIRFWTRIDAHSSELDFSSLCVFRIWSRWFMKVLLSTVLSANYALFL